MWFALSFPGKSLAFLELIFRLIIYFVPMTRTLSNLFSGLYLALREKGQGGGPQHILPSILGASQRWKKRNNTVQFTEEQPDFTWVIVSSACSIYP